MWILSQVVPIGCHASTWIASLWRQWSLFEIDKVHTVCTNCLWQWFVCGKKEEDLCKQGQFILELCVISAINRWLLVADVTATKPLVRANRLMISTCRYRADTGVKWSAVYCFVGELSRHHATHTMAPDQCWQVLQQQSVPDFPGRYQWSSQSSARHLKSPVAAAKCLCLYVQSRH